MKELIILMAIISILLVAAGVTYPLWLVVEALLEQLAVLVEALSLQ